MTTSSEYYIIIHPIFHQEFSKRKIFVAERKIIQVAGVYIGNIFRYCFPCAEGFIILKIFPLNAV